MIGLRTQEDDRFLTFFNKVQICAQKQDSIFFLDTSEGHDYSTSEMTCEDLSGWLIPKSISKQFQKGYLNFDDSDNWEDQWDKYYRFAIWDFDNSSLRIQFKKFE